MALLPSETHRDGHISFHILFMISHVFSKKMDALLLALLFTLWVLTSVTFTIHSSTIIPSWQFRIFLSCTSKATSTSICYNSIPLLGTQLKLAWTVITKHIKPGGSHTEIYFFTILDSGKSKIKVLAGNKKTIIWEDICIPMFIHS